MITLENEAHHERLFALGVAVGTAVGLVVGSAIALRVGDEGVESIRRFLDRVIGGEDHPKFEVLLQ